MLPGLVESVSNAESRASKRGWVTISPRNLIQSVAMARLPLPFVRSAADHCAMASGVERRRLDLDAALAK